MLTEEKIKEIRALIKKSLKGPDEKDTLSPEEIARLMFGEEFNKCRGR